MPSASNLASMFHRRLVLLLGIIALGMLVLSAQLVRLTVVQGAELRADAEAKLVTRTWSHAPRGRILDRKGRVLAQDRPSFDLTVDYQVISGEWARKMAAARAKADDRDAWRKLSREERQVRSDPYVMVYQAHVDAMWERIAREVGVPAERLAAKAADIERRVKAMSTRIYRARLHSVLDARLEAGEEITGDLDEQTRRRLERPIEEERSPQVVIPKITDQAGFALLGMQAQKVELAVPTPGGVVMETVPLMPGLEVLAAGDREYPLDEMRVEVDVSTLPEPVRATGAGPEAPLATGVKTIDVAGLAFHILGRMKPRAQKEDNDRRAARIANDEAFAQRVLAVPPAGMRGAGRPEDRGRYHDDDPAGLTGIEASQEDELRGLRGLKIKQLETGEEPVNLPPLPGRDVHLSIDIALQARVQAVMSPELGLAVAQEWHYREGTPINPTVPVGTPLNGAAVVLDVDSGEILAMVSTPSISRAALRDKPEAVFEDPMNVQADLPWLDRCVERPYPPGSIVKALVLNGAVKLGKLSLDSSIECNGHLYPDKPDMFRCWVYKQFGGRTHGPLNAPDALMVSCNIYFFTLGQRLGPQGITDTFAMFGLGQPWNLGVGREYAGNIGVRPEAGKPRPPLGVSDATQMGIGQGPVDWTPLHAADAYATLARGGVRLRPHLVREGGSPEPVELGLDQRAVRQALEGLQKSVNEDPGTGHHLSVNGRKLPHFNAPNVLVWGKTGTAQAPTLKIKEQIPDPRALALDPKSTARIPNPLWPRGVDAAGVAAFTGEPNTGIGAGERALRAGDHSWFVVLAGSKSQGRPQYAIAVMMEYAGSGGKVSGPIANQIIHALIAEGYLR